MGNYKIGEIIEVFGKKFTVEKIDKYDIVDLKPLEILPIEKKGNGTKGAGTSRLENPTKRMGFQDE